MSTEAGSRVYSIVTEPELRYLVIEATPGGWILRTFDIAGAEIGDRLHAVVHSSRTDAQFEAAGTYGKRLGNWWVVPSYVDDAAYFARCHKDAPPGQRQRLLD